MLLTSGGLIVARCHVSDRFNYLAPLFKLNRITPNRTPSTLLTRFVRTRLAIVIFGSIPSQLEQK